MKSNKSQEHDVGIYRNIISCESYLNYL